MNYTVYMLTFPNGKRYIGLTAQKPEVRWNNGNGYKGQYVYKAIEKYGWGNIEKQIVSKNITADEAMEMEMRLIMKYKTTLSKHGYNRDVGGSLGHHGQFPMYIIKTNKRGKHIKTYTNLEEICYELKIKSSSYIKEACINQKLYRGFYWNYGGKDGYEYTKRLRVKRLLGYLETLTLLNKKASLKELINYTKLDIDTILHYTQEQS